VSRTPGAGGTITPTWLRVRTRRLHAADGQPRDVVRDASSLLEIGYDSLRDFAPISTVAGIAFVMVTHPALPVKSVKDFVALARTRPGQLLFGSAGSGS